MLFSLKNIVCLLLINGTLLLPALTAHADSTADLIDEGNIAYLAGEYEKALSAYEEASVEAPESAFIYFNKGATFYQMGDYAAAIEALEKAALKSKAPRLEAKARFNLGNCAFREAERQQDSDLNKAIEALTTSIRHYQEALELNPEFVEAAENIEVARLVMKNILDAINKQKEAAQQQQEAMEQLKELIEKQQQALDRNQQLDDERSTKGDSEALRQQVQDLAEEQRDLQSETEALAKNMPKPAGQQPPLEETTAEKHLKNAAKEQDAASGNLEENHTSEAKTNQEKALEELKEALESLKGDQNKEGQQQQQQDQQQGNQQDQQGASSEETPQDQGEQQEDQEAEAQLMEDAHGILDEEKENRERRQMQAAGGYREVERDW